jgi:hypothetical protein
MTIICWDGITLAADKQMTCGNTKMLVTKIFKINNELIGITGNASIGMEVMDWYVTGAKAADFPPANRSEEKGASLIVVKADKTVWKFESSPVPYHVEGPFCAFGSGDLGGMVAMHLGADARTAVIAVCIYDCACGIAVDMLTLDSVNEVAHV